MIRARAPGDGGQPAATADVGLTVPLRLGLAGARSIGRDDPLPPLPFPPCDGRRRRALCVRGAFGVANTRVLIGAVFGGCRWWRGVLRGVHELRWRAEVHSSGRRCGLRGLPRQHVQSRRRPCDRVLRCASQQPTPVVCAALQRRGCPGADNVPCGRLAACVDRLSTRPALRSRHDWVLR
jgi:hypothetical protein